MKGRTGGVSQFQVGQNIVWLPEDGHLQYTLDGGATWQPTVDAPVVGTGTYNFLLHPLAADRVAANTFYLVDIDQVTGNLRCWRSTDGGAHWAMMGLTGAVSGTDYKLIADPNVAGKIWLDVSYGQGVRKSSDGGATWIQVDGLIGSGLIAFGKPAPGRTNPSVVFYGDTGLGKGVYVSPDDGATWLPFPSFAPRLLVIGPSALGQIVKHMAGHMLVPPDAGFLWEICKENTMRKLMLLAAIFGVLYAGAINAQEDPNCISEDQFHTAVSKQKPVVGTTQLT
jgi:hypothetical protein